MSHASHITEGFPQPSCDPCTSDPPKLSTSSVPVARNRCSRWQPFLELAAGLMSPGGSVAFLWLQLIETSGGAVIAEGGADGTVRTRLSVPLLPRVLSGQRPPEKELVRRRQVSGRTALRGSSLTAANDPPFYWVNFW